MGQMRRSLRPPLFRRSKMINISHRFQLRGRMDGLASPTESGRSATNWPACLPIRKFRSGIRAVGSSNTAVLGDDWI